MLFPTHLFLMPLFVFSRGPDQAILLSLGAGPSDPPCLPTFAQYEHQYVYDMHCAREGEDCVQASRELFDLMK
jgi:hypothetical protein